MIVDVKTADELLSEQGYIYRETPHKEGISYFHKRYDTVLIFYPDEKTYELIEDCYQGAGQPISVKEHKAINKKLEELGWI